MKLLEPLLFLTEIMLCECGCGQEIIIKPHNKRRYERMNCIPKYILGHCFKVNEIMKKILEKKKGKYIGKNNPRFGTHMSSEAKDKISKGNKGKCIGKYISDETKLKISKSRIGKYAGEKSSRWLGGISFLPYCQKFNRQLKLAVKERDNYTCQLCGAMDRKLMIHHVHYDKENCYPDLITLCNSDNSKVNGNRKHYESLFMNKLNDRELLFWTLSLYKEKTV